MTLGSMYEDLQTVGRITELNGDLFHCFFHGAALSSSRCCCGSYRKESRHQYRGTPISEVFC